MKSWMTMTECGVAAMLMLMTACGGQEGADKVKAEPATPKATASSAVAKDAVAVEPGTTAASPNAPAKQTPFSAEMSAEFMRKVMETSARIEVVKKEIADRTAVIYETNPEVKGYRSQLIAMQMEISKIMDTDPELATLKMNRDILWTTMPTFPRSNPHGGPARGFGPMK
jgi:hypothetical protein